MNTASPRSIAVTGGIACGKSASGEALAAMGVPVLDTDSVAHELLESDADVRSELRERFGVGVFAGEAVDRKALGRLVFGDEAARRDLEAILHPRIKARVREWMDSNRKGGTVAVQVPLLYEAGWADEFDQVICVACSPAIQRERLRERGLSEAEIDARLASQLPLREKIDRADVVVWTDGPKERAAEQWKLVMGK